MPAAVTATRGSEDPVTATRDGDDPVASTTVRTFSISTAENSITS